MSDHIHDCPGCGGYFECDLSGDDCTPETLCLQCQLDAVEAERDSLLKYVRHMEQHLRIFYAGGIERHRPKWLQNKLEGKDDD